MHLICNHKCGIEAQAEMTDDLVVVCLIFIFCNKICRTGKCDLVDVFFHLIRSHADTVIDKLDGLCIRINDNIHSGLVAFRKLVFSHHIQLL